MLQYGNYRLLLHFVSLFLDVLIVLLFLVISFFMLFQFFLLFLAGNTDSHSYPYKTGAYHVLKSLQSEQWIQIHFSTYQFYTLYCPI
jgi:hypothetical protein